MLLVTVILAAVLGGIGAGIGVLLAKALLRTADQARAARTRKLAAGTLGGLAAALAPALATSALGDRLAAGLGLKSKGELVLRQAMTPFIQDPRVQRQLEGKDAEFTHAYTAGLAARGITLLPVADLERWATLRLRLAEVSPAYCAGAWRGGLAPEELYRAMDALSDEEQRQWGELLTRAGLLALGTPHAPAVGGRALLDGMLAIAESLPPAERADFDRDVGLADPGAERACELLQLVFRRALTFAPAERESFLRALAAHFPQ